jgi:hypothetical protein
VCFKEMIALHVTDLILDRHVQNGWVQIVNFTLHAAFVGVKLFAANICY